MKKIPSLKFITALLLILSLSFGFFAPAPWANPLALGEVSDLVLETFDFSNFDISIFKQNQQDYSLFHSGQNDTSVFVFPSGIFSNTQQATPNGSFLFTPSVFIQKEPIVSETLCFSIEFLGEPKNAVSAVSIQTDDMVYTASIDRSPSKVSDRIQRFFILGKAGLQMMENMVNASAVTFTCVVNEQTYTFTLSHETHELLRLFYRDFNRASTRSKQSFAIFDELYPFTAMPLEAPASAANTQAAPSIDSLQVPDILKSSFYMVSPVVRDFLAVSQHIPASVYQYEYSAGEDIRILVTPSIVYAAFASFAPKQSLVLLFILISKNPLSATGAILNIDGYEYPLSISFDSTLLATGDYSLNAIIPFSPENFSVLETIALATNLDITFITGQGDLTISVSPLQLKDFKQTYDDFMSIYNPDIYWTYAESISP